MSLKSENMSFRVKAGIDNYWRWTLCGVTAPFMIIGFPSHLIFGDCDPVPGPMQIKTRFEWFKKVLNPSGQHPVSLLLTLIILPIALTLTAFVIYNIGIMFYQLLWLGDTKPELLFEAHDLFRTIPGVIPVLFGWLSGYNIKSFISSFDSTRVELINDIDNGGTQVLEERNYGRSRSTRKALLSLYFALLFAQGIHWYSERFTGTGVWIEHFVDLMHNMVLPVYCGFCWALASEYDVLANHLELLKLNTVQPTFDLFIKIKNAFRKIVNHTNEVNRIFKIFICWVFILAIVSILGKVLFATILLFGISTVKIILSSGLGIFGKFVKGFDLDGDGKLESHGFHEEDKNSTSPLQHLDASLADDAVRIATVYYVAAIIQFICVYYTLNQATAVNDKARYIHVLTNDYATEVAQQMTPELYNAYRLLKFYMHSTNEQFKSGLLKIPIAGAFPPMKARIQGYAIRS